MKSTIAAEPSPLPVNYHRWNVLEETNSSVASSVVRNQNTVNQSVASIEPNSAEIGICHM